MPDVTIAYKNSTIASITGSGAVSLSTAGRYCEDNITVEYTKPTLKLQEKTVTPTTGQQIITPDSIEYYAEIPVNTQSSAVYSSYTIYDHISCLYTSFDTGKSYKVEGEITLSDNTIITFGYVDTPSSSSQFTPRYDYVGPTGITAILIHNMGSDLTLYIERSAGTLTGTVTKEFQIYEDGQIEYDGLSKVTVEPMPIVGGGPFQEWALNLPTDGTSGPSAAYTFLASNSQHYNYFYSVSSIGNAAFMARYFSGDFIFNELTEIPSLAFATQGSISTIKNHTLSFPKCGVVYSAAFYYRKGLTNINLPVCTLIGTSAFYYCRSSFNISAPEVTAIDQYAFYGAGILNANFSKVTFINPNAFYYCTSLQTANFSVCSNIAAYAFATCSNLTTISFPSCRIIQSNAFSGCSKLTTINFPECSSIGSSAFYRCSSLNSLSFPKLQLIYNGAFSSCSNLSVASFPMCSSIYASAFYYCTKLESLYLMGSSVAKLGTSVFVYTPMSLSSYLGYFGSIYVPSSLLSSYQAATNWAAYSARMVGV